MFFNFLLDLYASINIGKCVMRLALWFICSEIGMGWGRRGRRGDEKEEGGERWMEVSFSPK